MAGLQVKDFVQPFDGTGDVIQWLTKVDLVAKLRKIRNVADIIPLFLEGAAFPYIMRWQMRRKRMLVAFGKL